MLSGEPRLVCYACQKPQVTCVCGAIPRIDNRTFVHVLQHPRERTHPFGTARFARLGLSHSDVRVAWDANVRETERPSWLPSDAVLLYPSPDARDLRELAERDRPTHLVVLDGTWSTARTLYRDKAWLKSLPAYRLSPDRPSRYRIRREPHADYISTIEAIVQALSVIEPDTAGLSGLIDAFDRMIDRQITLVGNGRDVRRLAPRRPIASRRIPRALAEHFDRVVVAYVESARENPTAPRELVQCAAVALRSRASFERLVRPSFALPDERHLAHMRLLASDFERAVNRPTFDAEFRHFLEAAAPSPIVLTWNPGALDLLRDAATPSTEFGAATETSVSRLSLKSAYRSVYQDSAGSLDEVIVHDALTVEPESFTGRAADRVAQAIAVARHLHELTTRA